MPLEIQTTKNANPKPRPDESELKFGRYFSDHAFLADYVEGKGWHDARVVPYPMLTLDPAASVLHYGQSMFEGLKAFRAPDRSVHLYRVDKHAKRMATGAPRLCIEPFPEEDFINAMRALVDAERDNVPSTPGTSLYLRPTLIADEPFLGVRPSHRYLFFVIGSPVGSYYGGDALKPVKIWVEREQVRAPRGGLGAVKAAANYVASMQAAVRAKKAGFDQVLWLDGKNHEFIEEVGTMNLFVVIDDVLITPPLSDSILAGVTRDSILTLAPSLGVKTEERPVSLAELCDATDKGRLSEVFGSGTAAVISPVAELALGDRRLHIGDGKPGPISQRFYDELSGIQRGTKPDPGGWRTPV